MISRPLGSAKQGGKKRKINVPAKMLKPLYITFSIAFEAGCKNESPVIILQNEFITGFKHSVQEMINDES
jgi:hypothetical protein